MNTTTLTAIAFILTWGSIVCLFIRAHKQSKKFDDVCNKVKDMSSMKKLTIK